MYTVSKFPHGAFSWADNSSSDPAASKAFYLALFGWEHIDIPIGEGMTYTIFQLDGANVCALSGMLPDQLRAGIPSHWNNFVTVDDVDALAAVIEAHGGKLVYGPVDVFDSGRMLALEDPTGAMLNLWQPRSNIGAGIVNTVGAMCWNELLTRDGESAKAFYGNVFGWQFHGDAPYIHIRNRGRGNGGMLVMDENFGEMPNCWLPYFNVADIDAAMKRVEELGGRVITQKMEAPDNGWFTVIEDPAGAVFYIMQLVKADPWIE